MSLRIATAVDPETGRSPVVNGREYVAVARVNGATFRIGRPVLFRVPPPRPPAWARPLLVLAVLALAVARIPRLACHDCGHHPDVHADDVACRVCSCGAGK